MPQAQKIPSKSQEQLLSADWQDLLSSPRQITVPSPLLTPSTAPMTGRWASLDEACAAPLSRRTCQ
eukprot:CAMPEP_0197631830 /NCGR_PEP_ID=MMETSP1338-20131121/8868_1 /TAXON_ID=43686 ORGANISM="Pelagodinium beii, Strain RCC1491" /NCGR_SAMPLE_ID=MMETSP1338 /ASSEMBLY_ACC=CAM_ASM_000754 /LENGTH=65 /DNA_ID=CAMNT_0043203367 /DNA_START=120 /DNA_END=314 /DNA_ORIENTATION=+